MLSEYRDPDSGHGTEAFFRALSEADGYIRDVERAAELACRCDELTALIDDIKREHPRVSGPDGGADECITCMHGWPCPTIELIEGK
jgi:hypothetical protein